LQEQLGYDLHRIVGDNHTVEYRYDYMTDLITDEAESIISSHNIEKPMYLQLAHLAAHSNGVEDVMEVRDWKEMNATLGYIKDLNRRKYASKYIPHHLLLSRVLLDYYPTQSIITLTEVIIIIIIIIIIFSLYVRPISNRLIKNNFNCNCLLSLQTL